MMHSFLYLSPTKVRIPFDKWSPNELLRITPTLLMHGGDEISSNRGTHGYCDAALPLFVHVPTTLRSGFHARKK